MLHSAEYRWPEAFAGRRVLVVGRGNSALQIAAELAKDARGTLVTRSPVRWVPQRPLGRDVHWWLTRFGVDSAPIGRWMRKRTLPVLDDGRYRSVGSVAGGEHDVVPFLAPTAALSPAGQPLHRGGISTTVPGLGYVGLEYQRTIGSATIRGVGRDAAHVLRRLPGSATA